MTEFTPYQPPKDESSPPVQPLFGTVRLWTGRVVLVALIGFASLLTVGSVLSGSRKTGNIDQLLDLQHPAAIVASKFAECVAHWFAVAAYAFNKRTWIVIVAILTAALLVWDVIADIFTPGFQPQYLVNHLDVAIPFLLIISLSILLFAPTRLTQNSG